MSFKTAARRYSSEFLSQPLTGISRYIRFLFVVYIVVSLLYTLVHFYTLFANYQSSGYLQKQNNLASERTVLGKIVLNGAKEDNLKSLWTGRFEVIAEHNSNPLQEVSDQLLYSKLFQYALKPTKIIPYYLKMTSPPVKSDITITTLITIERLVVLNKLVNRYKGIIDRLIKGPISVALHLQDDDHKIEALETLHQFHKSNPFFAKYVDLHLIIDKHNRQFNFWRNVARFFSRTDLIMTLDVDFMLCSDLRANYEKLLPEQKEMLLNGSAVFVIPAFEFTRKAVEMDVLDYPSTKQELLNYADNGELTMFHGKWRRGHGPTDYQQWYKANSVYPVVEYNYNYEPYVLMKRDDLPWCDERFVGYGANKAACLYEIYLSGVRFWVLPDDFLIHQRHPYPENDRRVERKYNKRLYEAFREEICFRYSRIFEGVPNTTAVDERICGSNFPNFYGL